MTFMQWIKQKYPGWKNIKEDELFRLNDAWDASREHTNSTVVELIQEREEEILGECGDCGAPNERVDRVRCSSICCDNHEV